jgi:hypothetical protein
MTSAVELRLAEVQDEANQLREALKAAKTRLQSAEEALRYYANPKSYKFKTNDWGGVVKQNILCDDNSEADAGPKTLIAGRRARNHFQTFQDKD